MVRILPWVLAVMTATASAGELTFAISNGSDVPMTVFQGQALSGGILKDFGDALAQVLHRTPRYLVLPRTRVESALVEGKADLLCDLRPEWLERQDHLWSDTIITNRMIVARRHASPRLTQIGQLAGMRVGTIRGYRYPEFDQLLPAIQRDDAANDAQNLDKLLHRRFDYMVTNRIYFDYQRKVHPERALLAADALTIADFDTYCALRPQGKFGLDALNRAINTLKARGVLRSILEKYRPG